MKEYKTKYELTISDVPIEYRVPITGKYNVMINRCVKCESHMDEAKILGFCEFTGYVAILKECPDCFEKQYYHINEEMLETSINIIKFIQTNE